MSRSARSGGPALGAPASIAAPEVKQFSEACEQNRLPILDILKQTFSETHRVLEIGSGTGQHAVFFSRHLPHLQWQPSDLEDQLPSIRAWRAEAGLANISPPLSLDVCRERDWPDSEFDGVFSANTVHIMSWQAVECMFAGIGRQLRSRGRFCLYGPFNYGNRFTSPGNRQFDAWLKHRDASSGVRNFEDLDELAGSHGMSLQADHEMPVNNRLLVWEKS